MAIVLSVLGGFSIAAGLVFMLGGAIGVLRFPDVYTRVHAVNAADGVGAALVALGLGVVSGDAGIALRLLLLSLLFLVLAPVLTQLVANAAHSAGLAPVSGRYAARRPGERKEYE